MASAVPAAYRSNDEHLTAALAWLDDVLALRTERFRQRRAGAPTSHTLSISHEEVDWLLSPAGPVGPETEEVQRLRRQLRATEERTEAATRRSLEEGVYLALPQLARLFALSPFECRAVVVCLAPELDRKYDRIYAYLQDDFTRKRPSVDLILDLLCENQEQRRVGGSLLGEHGALARADIVQRTSDPASPSGSSGLAQFLGLDPRILSFILDRSHVDSRLLDLARAHHPGAAQRDPFVDPSLVQGIARLVERRGASPMPDRRCVLLHLSGPSGVGKHELALATCARTGCHLLIVDIGGLLRRGPDFERLLRLSFRESVLTQAAIYLDDADALDGDDAKGALKAVARVASQYGWLVFMGGEQPCPEPGLFREALFLSLKLPLPDAALRTAAWERSLEQFGAQPSWAADLAHQFRLTPGQIGDAVASAALEAATRETQPGLEAADLYRACRRLADHRLGDLAFKVEPRSTWEDLVLPLDAVLQIREVCDQVRHHQDVFGQWGFGRKVSRSRGVSVLFSGPPGTGKTLAAEVVAGELGLDLYKVDLSGVVSKYIGETEKNLSRIFREAEASNAILFFDEADALFGKRTEVSDAHDRYANIETSYLLQRMEAHEGIVILATNIRENMDDAFTRRIRFIVDFPFPDQASRRRIWETHFPIEAPVGPDVDLDCLARELKVAGGSIRNIVLNAAFLAAANGRVINMEHLQHATRREFGKIGKLWDVQAFAERVHHG